nr:hypothetical protein [uncultured Moraxella sp.]
MADFRCDIQLHDYLVNAQSELIKNINAKLNHRNGAKNTLRWVNQLDRTKNTTDISLGIPLKDIRFGAFFDLLKKLNLEIVVREK